MLQIMGDFREEILTQNQVLMMNFFLHTIPLAKRKQTRYLSIAFINEYLASLFPNDRESIEFYERRLQMKSAVFYIANELLTNSMKFNCENIKYPIEFGICSIDGRELVFVTSNCVSDRNLEKLKSFVGEITTSDANELYFRQIEKGAAEKSEESRLGFLSIINDYKAKLGWKIETVSQEPEITIVTTMVQIET